jgi:hypothetical protein
MTVFDRELDDLEENIVKLLLVFFFSTFLTITLGRAIGLIGLMAGTAASLSFLAASAAISLWILRYFGSPIYERLFKPEGNKLQSFLGQSEGPESAPQDSSQTSKKS